MIEILLLLQNVQTSLISDYEVEYETKENKNPTRFENFKTEINLNHNIAH